MGRPRQCFCGLERGRPAGQSSFKYRVKFQSGALRCRRRIMLNQWHAYIRATQVGWDANVVVAMRLMRLTAGGALAQREAQGWYQRKLPRSWKPSGLR